MQAVVGEAFVTGWEHLIKILERCMPWLLGAEAFLGVMVALQSKGVGFKMWLGSLVALVYIILLFWWLREDTREMP